jgi:hypothetical protein
MERAGRHNNRTDEADEDDGMHKCQAVKPRTARRVARIPGVIQLDGGG